MKKYLFFLGMALVALIFSSCNGKKGVFTPTSSGRAYEILVVVDHALWERPAGRALYDVLDTDVPGLPQSERSFRIMYTSPKDYDSTLKLIRNIIIVDVRDIYTKPAFKYAKDVYAAPQLILTIQAPNEQEFEKFVEENKQQIIDFFTRAEMNRQIAQLQHKHNDYISTKVGSKFDCDIWLPAELASSKEGKDFFWASSNTASGLVNICMYSYPYEGPRTFNKQYVLAKRDSVMKANIPGTEPRMYMATDTLCTSVKPITVKGEYAMETRGLWKMEHDAMGGPFVSHSRVDTLNNRVVVAEGFVYAPEKMKRGLIRRLEAALYTLCLPGEQARELKASIPEVSVVAGKEQE